jgi:hypothetical protein
VVIELSLPWSRPRDDTRRADCAASARRVPVTEADGKGEDTNDEG